MPRGAFVVASPPGASTRPCVRRAAPAFSTGMATLARRIRPRAHGRHTRVRAPRACPASSVSSAHKAYECRRDFPSLSDRAVWHWAESALRFWRWRNCRCLLYADDILHVLQPTGPWSPYRDASRAAAITDDQQTFSTRADFPKKRCATGIAIFKRKKKSRLCMAASLYDGNEWTGLYILVGASGGRVRRGE